MLLTFCACGAKPAEQTEAPTDATTDNANVEATEDSGKKDKEDPFKDINELEPNDEGEYQIHSAAGLLNMANNLDGEYKLLCDIDMGGAEWVPLGTQDDPFTGKLNGDYFTISNFTISQPTEDGDMGMFGVNKGNVVNLLIKDLQITATEDTKRVGAIAGLNKGNIRRSDIYGTLDATKLADGASVGGAAGESTKLVETSVIGMDILCDAAGKACVGGGVGIQDGGKFLYNTVAGKLEVTGGENKNVGLFIGYANDTELEDTKFTGAANKVDGQLYMELFGVAEDTENVGYALRDNSGTNDPLPADAMERRQKVLDLAYEMATVEWTSTKAITQENSMCGCTGGFTVLPGQVYRGIPYNHKSGSMDRFYYCMEENEDGMLVLKDWVQDLDGTDADEDTWGAYIGNDCSSAMQMIYGKVSNHCSILRSVTQFPIYATEDYEIKEAFPLIDVGTIPVGWECDLEVPSVEYIKGTSLFTDKIGEQGMYEAYSQMRAGDMISNSFDYAMGHCQIVTCDAVVMRDEEGNLDPDASYVTTIQQVANFADYGDYISSWRVDNVLSFRQMLEKWYIPVTFKELNEGSDEKPELTMENQAEGRMGLVTGVINSNFYIDSVEMTVTDEDGNVVLNKRNFPTVDKSTNSGSEFWTIRNMPKTFDMVRFAKDVSEVQWDVQKTYNCNLKVYLLSEDIIDFMDFTF